MWDQLNATISDFIVASSWSHIYLLIKDARSLDHKFIIFEIWVSYSVVAEDATCRHVSLCQVLYVYTLSTGKYLLAFLRSLCFLLQSNVVHYLYCTLTVHPAFVLSPFVLRTFVLSLLLWRPLTNYITSWLVIFHFRFNTFWMAAFCYTNPIFLMEKSFLIYVFLI